MDDQDSKQLGVLKGSPSVDRWEVEIRRILHGKRNYELERLGSAEEFIAVALVESDDAALAETTFHTALNNVVQVWQPAEPQALYFLRTIIELIRAFTPSAGFHKLLGQLERWQRFVVSDPVMTHSGCERMALAALEQYYPTPPIGQDLDSAFQAYIVFLRKMLQDHQYLAHVMRRLVELGVLSVGSQELREALAVAEESELLELVRFLLGTRKQFRDAFLSEIYDHCLRRHLHSRFKQEIEFLGAALVHSDFPSVRLAEGNLIKLEISAEMLDYYITEVRWREGPASGLITMAKVA